VAKPIEIVRGAAAMETVALVGGTFELASTPSGAEVWQEGRRVGVTPYRVAEAVPGRHALTLKQTGFKDTAVALTVSARQSARESVALEKIGGAEPGQPWTIPELNLTLMPIAAGTFTMGDESGDADEKPLTRVTLTQPFWFGKTEVTQREWQAVMDGNPSNFQGENLPVEKVSWDEAMEFCQKLTARERAADRMPEGYAYTLPTEAQWEYACRAGTAGDYAGNLADMAWCSENSGKTTHAGGAKRANAWGLHDMHGNVWEWCADWYADKLPGGAVRDPTGAASGSDRVNRGGGWVDAAVHYRSANRGRDSPGVRFNDLGFRLALSVGP
jgi:formylglycine-generating enzyme required for sulfatase activity